MELLKGIKRHFNKGKEGGEEFKHYADVIVFDVFGNMLLMQRSYQDDFMAGMWCLPGGKIELNETPLDAAYRELYEETFLKVQLTHIKTVNKTNCEINYHIGFLTNNPLLILDNEEHYRYQFVSLDELANYELLLDLHDTLLSMNLESYLEPNIVDESSQELVIENVDLSNVQKAFNKGQLSEEDYIKFLNVHQALDVIRKGNENGRISDERLVEYIIKAKHYEFVKVIRDGKTFYQYREVGTDKAPEDNMEVGGSFEDEKTGLNVQLYSDKAFLISGKTFQNIELLRNIKSEIGIGTWNKTLNGWVFPSNSKGQIMAMLAEKMDVSTYEGQVEKDNAIAIKNAVDPGTKVSLDGEETTVSDVSAVDGKAVYTINDKEGNEVEATEESVGITPISEVDDIGDALGNTDESSRFKTEKEIFGKQENEVSIADVDSKPTSIGVKEFTTRSGVKVNALDFTEVPLKDIAIVPINGILEKERPYYIPDINELNFCGYRDDKFVFDFVKIDDDSYLVALNGYNRQKPIVAPKRYKDGDNEYAVMSLDNIVAMSEYYRNKRKAELKVEGEEKTERNRQYFLSMNDAVKERYLTYSKLSEKQQAKYSKEQWDSLSIGEKEAEMPNFKTLPYKKFSSKRINVLDEDTMLQSNFTMYKEFVNSDYQVPVRRFTSDDPCAIEYKEVRDNLKWKANDMQIQREENESSFVKGRETSYGDSNTKDDLLDTLGVKVKAQNGSEITATQIEQIRTNLDKVYESFGDRSEMSKKYGLKISHAGDKHMHAMKAIGVYFPFYKAIGVTDNEHGKFGFTLAHEFAHFMDNYVGGTDKMHYASDKVSSTANKIASTFRKNMNVPSSKQTNYINRTCECFARAFEQYHAMKHFGDDAVKSKAIGASYSDSDEHVSAKKFNDSIKPLIEQFLSENNDVLKSVIYPELNVIDEVEIIEKAADNNADPSHGGKLVKVTRTTHTGKKTTKWVLPSEADGEIDTAKNAGHSVDVKHKKLNDKELKEYAKNTPESALKDTIANSADPKLRKFAHEELNRRSKHEAIQKEKDKK